MADNILVDYIASMDKGRQAYNNAVTTYYGINQDDVPKVNGLLKSIHDEDTRTKLLIRSNGKWVTIAYEDPVPSSMLYYDSDTDKIVSKKIIDASIISTKDFEASSADLESITAKEGEIENLTAKNLNIVNNINQTITETLLVKDNTLVLNSGLTENPDSANYKKSGIEITRGSYKNAELKWDEDEDCWIMTSPGVDSIASATYELVGLTQDNSRKLNLTKSKGIFADSDSAAKNVGFYVTDNSYDSGIFYNHNSSEYNLTTKTKNVELIGTNLDGSYGEIGKLILSDSPGIEIRQEEGAQSSLDFTFTDKYGVKRSQGSLFYNTNSDRITVKTESQYFELRDPSAIDPYAYAWYCDGIIAKGAKTISLPSGYQFLTTNKASVHLYLNGVHISPSMYTITDLNTIVLNTAVTDESSYSVYHNSYIAENYRLPMKSSPIIVTGLSGHQLQVVHGPIPVDGDFQCLVVKNGLVLAQDSDFVVTRVTQNVTDIVFNVAINSSDKVVVYPFLSPNVFVRTPNALIFDVGEYGEDSNIDNSGTILFTRGDLPSAGLRWNEANDNLELNNGSGIWEPINSSSTKFDMQRYVITEIANTINIGELLSSNGILTGKGTQISVFKNGLLLAEDYDYTISGYMITFANNLAIGDIIYVYAGRSFIKTYNYLISKHDIQTLTSSSMTIKYPVGFRYEPGSESLHIFVDGSLQTRGKDYVEISASEVKFNKILPSGSIINSFCPTVIEAIRYGKRKLEFNATDVDNFLTSSLANCEISVYRGNSNDANIKWDETKDSWTFNNGDGNDYAIPVIVFDNKFFTPTTGRNVLLYHTDHHIFYAYTGNKWYNTVTGREV